MSGKVWLCIVGDGLFTLRPVPLRPYRWIVRCERPTRFTSNDLTTQFEYPDDPRNVIIDLSNSSIWDASTVAALDAVTHKYERLGKKVSIVGLNSQTKGFHANLTGNLGAEN